MSWDFLNLDFSMNSLIYEQQIPILLPRTFLLLKAHTSILVSCGANCCIFYTCVIGIANHKTEPLNIHKSAGGYIQY